MADYEINIMPYFETSYVLPCRSTALSLSSCEDEEAPSFLKHYEGSFNHEAMEIKMTRSRHLEMRKFFSSLDDTFSMSISLLKEKLLLAANPRLLWFWRAFGGERI